MRTWKSIALAVAAAALLLPAAASAAFEHVVSAGESLSSVAAADGLTVDQLASANGLSPNSQLVAGTNLAIPPQTAAGTAAPGAAPATSTATSSATSTSGDTEPDGDSDDTSSAAGAAPAASTSSGGYLVQPGDTLSSIAARFGVTVDQLAAANGMSPNGLLLYGTHISVSGTPTSTATPTATATPVSYTSSTSSTAAPAAASTSGPQPTSQYVSPGEVGAIAAQNGVPASLAEAIGYQESGFNNGLVSNTGATGVMQIEPGTWNYIGANLAGPPPLSPSSATDNIRAGTLYLRSLLAQTGGDPAMAAAAYYQGLQSVQQHGLYADTKQYVNNVMALQQRFGGQ